MSSSFFRVAIMRVRVQSPLPVDEHVDSIVSLVRREKRVVILAPPGAGKTTRIPPALVELGGDPAAAAARRARALARRTRSAVDDRREIGWQIRFERRFSARTRLLVATEGILTARLRSDPAQRFPRSSSSTSSHSAAFCGPRARAGRTGTLDSAPTSRSS
jgi:HrpA-like RNA helicase